MFIATIYVTIKITRLCLQTHIFCLREEEGPVKKKQQRKERECICNCAGRRECLLWFESFS